uniref:hypothetical protein n=1 Tax=uncultured Acinetobacter sp. TaxID=165433 RepID=UPI00261D79B7|nr:hypothetical protein [uncultured Acinetobacter sp.]
MKIQENLHCLTNLKHIKQLHDAGIDVDVIAHFFQSENIPLSADQIAHILHSIDALNKKQIPSSKLTALMSAKADIAESEQIPCPV